MSTTTSVRIEVELFILARKKGVNLSNLMNSVLRAHFKNKEDDMSDEQVAEIFRAKNARVETAVEKEVKEADAAQEAALRELQTAFNQYVMDDPTHATSQKLAWITERRKSLPALGALSNEAVLIELQGTPV